MTKFVSAHGHCRHQRQGRGSLRGHVRLMTNCLDQNKKPDRTNVLDDEFEKSVLFL